MQLIKSSEPTDAQLKELLDEAFKKIKSTTEQDSKKLSDMNNSLNWILTLSTVFFVFYTRTQFVPEGCWEKIVLLTAKISFVTLTAVLIIHNIFYIRYEDYKGAYLASLHTHVIDLKFNLPLLKPKLQTMTPFATYQFINAFRDGEFLYNYDAVKSREDFKRYDRRIKRSGKWLKATYWIGLSIFMCSFLAMIYVLFIT